MLRLSLAPSVFTSEWQEIKILGAAGGNAACEQPDYSRDADICRAFIGDSKGGREELLHGIFANVGFWPEKVNMKCWEGAV